MKRTEVEQLLDNLCVEFGFCFPPDRRAHFCNSPPSTVKAFTDGVFVAEGLDPQFADKHLWRQVQKRVAEYFKNMASDNAV